MNAQKKVELATNVLLAAFVVWYLFTIHPSSPKMVLYAKTCWNGARKQVWLIMAPKWKREALQVRARVAG